MHGHILRFLVSFKQMQSIIKALGRPHATKWPALAKLKRWKKNEGDIQNFKPNKREARDLGALLKLDAGSQALRLIGRMLEYDPSKRLTAAEALEDEYFRTPPFAGHNCFCDGFPTEPKALPYADRTRKKQKQQSREGRLLVIAACLLTRRICRKF